MTVLVTKGLGRAGSTCTTWDPLDGVMIAGLPRGANTDIRNDGDSATPPAAAGSTTYQRPKYSRPRKLMSTGMPSVTEPNPSSAAPPMSVVEIRASEPLA